MKRNKIGVSLIVLVITIIVMIILASAVIISLSNTNIIDKANDAVDKSNLQQVQQLASLIWAEAYLDDVENLDEAYIRGKLEEKGIKSDNYSITVTGTGVAVRTTTLGDLIKSAADYGKTVNYSANGVTDWKVFYKQTTVAGEEYVYLIASESVPKSALPTNIPDTSIGEYTVTVNGKNMTYGTIYWNGFPTTGIMLSPESSDRWLARFGDYSITGPARCVSYFLNETYWTAFKNEADYKDQNGNSYVVGAIGTPTLEMFIASWNAKREATGDTTTYDKELSVEKRTTGYVLNISYPTGIATTDNLYITTSYQLAAPYYAQNPTSIFGAAHFGAVYEHGTSDPVYGVRPVVCLKSNIPARSVGTSGCAI